MNDIETPPPEPRHVAAIVRNRIVTGLFLVIPVFVTLWVVLKTYNLATNWAFKLIAQQPFIGVLKHNGEFPFWFAPGVKFATLVLLLIMLFLVGVLARYTLFRRTLGAGERLILQAPLVKIVYMTCKQIIEAVTKPGGGMFRQVVIFEYPRPGIWVLGFVTNEDTDAIGFGKYIGQDLYRIFLPTTPNPTSGFLLFVPKQDCQVLDMTVTDAMRLIVSGGAINHESLAPPA